MQHLIQLESDVSDDTVTISGLDVTSPQVPLTNQSHGEIFDYKVSWAKTKDKNQSNQTNVSRSNHSLTLTLDPSEEYMVTVTARNINGSSSPSTIIIPRCNLGMKLTEHHTLQISSL